MPKESPLIYFAKDGQYLGPKAGTSPTGVTSKVGFNENATLPFQPGKTYRLRVVNVSAFAMFFFWIDGHDMRIIEVDGVCPPFVQECTLSLNNTHRLMSKRRL
jgi:iron transport multicopper oxidase